MWVSIASNPFSSRCIRPGAIPFIFPPGINAKQIVHRLQCLGLWGQIIGPHGSGKSTLLRSIIPALGEDNWHVEFFTLNNRQRRFPFSRKASATWDKNTIVVVDGFEQLNWWNQLKLKRTCRHKYAGLLVTAHRCVQLPTILETHVSLDLATTIVFQLLNRTPQLIFKDDVAECFRQCQGNLRETLFKLYDVYERRKDNGPPAAYSRDVLPRKNRLDEHVADSPPNR